MEGKALCENQMENKFTSRCYAILFTAVMCAVVLGGYMGYLYARGRPQFGEGVILIQSRSPTSSEFIVVRKFSTNAPFSFVPIPPFSDFSPMHRFELHGSYGNLLSAQFYRHSINADTATVIWENSGAIVYLNDVRAMLMDKYGYWSDPK